MFSVISTSSRAWSDFKWLVMCYCWSGDFDSRNQLSFPHFKFGIAALIQDMAIHFVRCYPVVAIELNVGPDTSVKLVDQWLFPNNKLLYFLQRFRFGIIKWHFKRNHLSLARLEKFFFFFSKFVHPHTRSNESIYSVLPLSKFYLVYAKAYNILYDYIYNQPLNIFHRHIQNRCYEK